MATKRKSGENKVPTREFRRTHSSFPLRIAAGLGDPERERQILGAFDGEDEIVVAERCLSADQLLARVREGQLDAVLVASDLHRLNSDRLTELEQMRIPSVILVPDLEDDRWERFGGIVLPANAGPEAIRQGILAAIRGERNRPTPTNDDAQESVEPVEISEDSATALSVITVAGGPGSPGRTTVALNLAAALGSVASTVLVDADLTAPSAAVFLDADPTCNLGMLAHGEPVTPGEWKRALTQEVQPLDSRSPRGVVLCGAATPELRSCVSRRFFERLIAELQQCYRYVVVDIGSDLSGPEARIHRAALDHAQQILLVASADLVGLWRAQNTLALLETYRHGDTHRVALVINRHDRHHHHGQQEVEWALGVPVAAVVPHDHRHAQRALTTQRPLVTSGGRASRVLLDLAQRAHGGDIVLPSEPSTRQRKGPLGRILELRPRRTAKPRAEERIADGDYVTDLS